MVKIACKDINPNTDCTFEVRGNTPTDVAKKMLAHMKTDHTDDVKAMNMTDDEMMTMIESKVHA